MPKSSTLEAVRVASRLSPIRFLAVIVLYKLAPQDSSTFRSLQTAAARLSSDHGSLTILLHDNTPGRESFPDVPADVPANVLYQNAPHNAGLADTFNDAIDLAARQGFDWLITLDQDTELPAGFLQRISEVASGVSNDPSIAAIVPQIRGDGRILSPNWFWAGAIPRWFPTGYVGVPSQPTFAFNSGAVLRVDALRQVGGYNQKFWLDNSDASLFRQLHRFGKRVFVAGDIQVDHNFSMLNKKHRMTLARYHNILMAESAFWDLTMNPLAGAERTARLAVRWCRQGLHREDPEFRKETFNALIRRVFSTRRSRLKAWNRELKNSNRIEPELRKSHLKPRISICVATCDGEPFVRAQLASILPQLDSGDEIVVVDDASMDRTKDVILAMADDRIRLIEQPERQGVVKTFEHAVRAASGDVLFLCDQDDLWAPEKVSKMMDVFAQHTDITVVTSAVQTIDDNGVEVFDSVYSQSRPFSASLLQNLLSNRFQGSTMAFRASLIPLTLPFPQGFHLLHDAWIGARNSVTGGRTIFLEEKLLLYRRHGQNVSRRLNVVQQFLKRVRLVLALSGRWFADKWNRYDAVSRDNA